MTSYRNQSQYIRTNSSKDLVEVKHYLGYMTVKTKFESGTTTKDLKNCTKKKITSVIFSKLIVPSPLQALVQV